MWGGGAKAILHHINVTATLCVQFSGCADKLCKQRKEVTAAAAGWPFNDQLLLTIIKRGTHCRKRQTTLQGRHL